MNFKIMVRLSQSLTFSALVFFFITVNGFASAPVGDDSADIKSVVSEKYSHIRQHVDKAGSEAEQSVEGLAQYLVKSAKPDEEKAYAVFYWLTQNIVYDTQGYFTGDYGNLTPEGVLQSRKAVCSGYSRLFKGLAEKVGLEVVEITGQAKGYEFTFDGKLGAHAWNAVKLKGQWKLVDATWGAGFLSEGGQFIKQFDEFYFLSSPEHLIYSHLPNDSKWQLIKKPVSLD